MKWGESTILDLSQEHPVIFATWDDYAEDISSVLKQTVEVMNTDAEGRLNRIMHLTPKRN